MRQSAITIIRALIVSCAMMLLPFASSAATITIDFKGTTTGVGGLATGIWSGQGTDVTGSLSYDLALFDDNPSADYDRFNEAIAKNAGLAWSIEYTLGKTTKSYTEAGSTPFVFNLNGVTDQYAFGAGRFNILVNGAGLKLDGTAPDYAPDVTNAKLAKGYYWIEGRGVDCP